MTEIYCRLDTIWDNLLQVTGYKPDIQCQQGCAHCCYLPVMCPPDVAFHVAGEIRDTWHHHDIAVLIDDISNISESYRKSESSGIAFFREKCPFLNEKNQCRIYEIRPISCRSFTSNNVNRCESLMRLGTTEGVDQNLFRYMLHQAATSSLEQASKEKGRSPEQVFFPPAVKAAIENPQIEYDWQDGQSISKLIYVSS